MGNPGKRASAQREPDPDYLQDLTPPEWLSAGARVVWLEEAPKFRAARLLTTIDVMAFAALCRRTPLRKQREFTLAAREGQGARYIHTHGRVRRVRHHGQNAWLKPMYRPLAPSRPRP